MRAQGDSPTTTQTAAGMLARIERANVLSQILSWEPKLLPTIQHALEQQLGKASSVADYDRHRIYVVLKQACMHLVGREAENPALRTNRHWEVFVAALFDALPPDGVERGIEQGEYEGEESGDRQSDW
jgi:hypothetical protein